MNERGSVAPLIAGFLSLILLAMLLAISSLTALVTSQRVQGLADAAVIYAHDQSNSKGATNLKLLDQKVLEFLNKAPSVRALKLTSVSSWVENQASVLRICAIWQDPLLIQNLPSREICKVAKAKSFVVF